MKFKEGDRVHVTRLDRNNVDFYGTLKIVSEESTECYMLLDCTDKDYEYEVIYKERYKNFGKDKTDYYTLAKDEEDTDKPEIQYINDMYNDVPKENEQNHKVELKNHYIVEVKKGLYVRNATSNYFFKFTKNINKADVYEYENAAMKHAEFVDGRVLNLKRYVEV